VIRIYAAVDSIRPLPADLSRDALLAARPGLPIEGYKKSQKKVLRRSGCS
jgi:hypothetical protein